MIHPALLGAGRGVLGPLLTSIYFFLTNVWRTVRHQSKAEQAYTRLRGMILSCELAPGVWVTVAELADQIEIGRTPTYEALARLESDGFVRPVKRRGWQVTPLTLHTVNEIIDAYRVTAPELAVMIAENASDEELERLRQLNDEWSPGSAPPNPGSAPFSYFVEICGNGMLVRINLILAAHFERVMNLALLQGSFSDESYLHWRDAVHEALSARDGQRAREALIELIDVGASELNRILLQNGSPQTARLTAESRAA